MSDTLTIDDVHEITAVGADGDTYEGRAGGTVVVCAVTPDGLAVCVSDGDHDGEPFTPGRRGDTYARRLYVGAYESETARLDGADPVAVNVGPGEPATVAAAVAVARAVVARRRVPIVAPTHDVAAHAWRQGPDGDPYDVDAHAATSPTSGAVRVGDVAEPGAVVLDVWPVVGHGDRVVVRAGAGDFADHDAPTRGDVWHGEAETAIRADVCAGDLVAAVLAGLDVSAARHVLAVVLAAPVLADVRAYVSDLVDVDDDGQSDEWGHAGTRDVLGDILDSARGPIAR